MVVVTPVSLGVAFRLTDILTCRRYPDDLVEQKMQVLLVWRNAVGRAASVAQLVTHLQRLRPAQTRLVHDIRAFVFGPGQWEI